jgi:hypothetical protein
MSHKKLWRNRNIDVHYWRYYLFLNNVGRTIMIRSIFFNYRNFSIGQTIQLVN